jgi:acyl-CoA thioester hydrolase
MTHWELPTPHVVELNVQPADIDAYGHVNNSVYLTWLDRAAWSHSAALGMPLADCLALRRGMAAQRIEIEYLRAAVGADQVRIATWIVQSDARLRCARRFQVWRPRDRATLARAGVDYVCINLDSGRAARMPGSFTRAYVVSTTAGGG